MRDHLGIGIRPELHPLDLELFLERQEVLKYPVVDDGKVAGRVEVGVGVELGIAVAVGGSVGSDGTVGAGVGVLASVRAATTRVGSGGGVATSAIWLLQAVNRNSPRLPITPLMTNESLSNILVMLRMVIYLSRFYGVYGSSRTSIDSTGLP